MALSKAIDFVKCFSSDPDFSVSCNKNYKNKEALLSAFDFTEGELDDAVNMHLVKCQTHEQAETFLQMRFWYLLL